MVGLGWGSSGVCDTGPLTALNSLGRLDWLVSEPRMLHLYYLALRLQVRFTMLGFLMWALGITLVPLACEERTLHLSSLLDLSFSF